METIKILESEWKEINNNYYTDVINEMFPNGFISYAIQRKRNNKTFECIINELKSINN